MTRYPVSPIVYFYSDKPVLMQTHRPHCVKVRKHGSAFCVTPADPYRLALWLRELQQTHTHTQREREWPWAEGHQQAAVMWKTPLYLHWGSFLGFFSLMLLCAYTFCPGCLGDATCGVSVRDNAPVVTAVWSGSSARWAGSARSTECSAEQRQQAWIWVRSFKLIPPVSCGAADMHPSFQLDVCVSEKHKKTRPVW